MEELKGKNWEYILWNQIGLLRMGSRKDSKSSAITATGGSISTGNVPIYLKLKGKRKGIKIISSTCKSGGATGTTNMTTKKEKKVCSVCGGRGHKESSHDFKPAVARGESKVKNY